MLRWSNYVWEDNSSMYLLYIRCITKSKKNASKCICDVQYVQLLEKSYEWLGNKERNLIEMEKIVKSNENRRSI